MTIDLYHVPESGPCRSVRLVAAALGVDLNLKYVNLMAGENRSPEFLKMNPQHAVPVLDENGFYLSESRAICQYLADKYSKDDSLYPKDPAKRAVVNQRLFFDLSTLYQSFYDCFLRPLWLKEPAAPIEKLHEALGHLENFLEKQNYVAGNNLTIADIVLQCTLSNLSVFDFDFSKYQKVSNWFAKVKSEVPRYKEINEEGLKSYKILIDRVKSM